MASWFGTTRRNFWLLTNALSACDDRRRVDGRKRQYAIGIRRFASLFLQTLVIDSTIPLLVYLNNAIASMVVKIVLDNGQPATNVVRLGCSEKQFKPKRGDFRQRQERWVLYRDKNAWGGIGKAGYNE
jgi:hypothetical protein